MAGSTIILRPQPGIKRDGTRFEGDAYVDGQWVRWQRGLPRKMGGYRSVQNALTEVSRGLTAFTQQGFVYVHSGGGTKLSRFTLDPNMNSSILSDRTPIAAKSSCTVTLTGGGAGSVDSLTINAVAVLSGAVPFNTSLSTTAGDVVTNINGGTGTHGYTASNVGAVITIEANIALGSNPNGYVTAITTTTITATKTNMSGGSFALTTSSDNVWSFDYQYDSSTNKNYLIAHVAPNNSCVCNDSGGQIFFGEVMGTSPLKSISLPTNGNATGGIVALHPYLFYYGTDGIVGWSVAGELTDLTDTGSGANIARPWGQKIIKGLPLRAGGGDSPSGLFWAYDAVIRATWVGGTTVFRFDVLATDTSILNSHCVVDYDGTFFWCGVDRFMMFNGVVREVPNQMNLNYFFDGLNPQAKNKVFAFKMPKYGEIWWCYPRGDATECTHAVILNIRENTWYDTELPHSGRSAGRFCNAFGAPIISGVDNESGYKVWVHEQLSDEYDGPDIRPIKSYFETSDISLLTQGRNEGVRVSMIEPDFVQSGPMNVQVTGRANPRAPEVVSDVVVFPETASESNPFEQIVALKESRRELRLRFESNAPYGDYQMGQVVLHVEPGDGTVLG